MTAIAYPFEEFCEHMWVASQFRNPSPSLEDTAIRLCEHMHSQGLEMEKAIYKAAQCAMINNYIARHLPDFGVGDVAVVGSPDIALVSEHLYRAVHAVFTAEQCSPEDLGLLDPSPEAVLRLARRLRANTSSGAR